MVPNTPDFVFEKRLLFTLFANIDEVGIWLKDLVDETELNPNFSSGFYLIKLC